MSRYGWICLVVLVSAGPGTGQQAFLPGTEDPLGPATERGIRMTPGMARGLARIYTNQVLIPRYELDAARAGDATELVARRIMSTAHTLDAGGAELIERLIIRVSEAEADSRDAQARGESVREDPFSTEFQQEFAERALPALPAVRDLIGGVGRDVGPLLSFRQQLRLAGELAVAATALDGFEKNLQRWARGGGRPRENPFDTPAEDALTKDASGETAALRSARQAAEDELDKQDWIHRIWENYLKQFKNFYALDESQCATADSLLRDYLDRAQVIMQDRAWRDQIYRSRLWLQMSGQLQMDRAFRNILNSRYEEAMAPINALGDEFRLRLEAIPTGVQKHAAEARIMTALKERGYENPEGN